MLILDWVYRTDMAVIAVNSWNRLAIPFRSEPGVYQPRGKKPA